MVTKLNKYLFTTFLIIVSVLNTEAQQTYKMVENGNKWYEFGGYSIPGIGLSHIVYRIYSFSSDTLINGTSYKQLHAQVLDSLLDVTPSVSIYTHYAGAFRQDSLKVFFVPTGNTSENLYCDFDLNVADTLNYYYNTYPNIKVDSIFNIPFGTTTRKKYKLSNSMYFYDGIGNYLGLFKDFAFSQEGDAYAVCFEQQGITENINSWGLNSGITCPFNIDAFVGLKEYNRLDEIEIFPIPFSDYCTIKFANKKSNGSLKIYNMLGELVKNIDNITDNTLKIERENFKSGLYFIVVTDENRSTITKKIIVE